MCWDVGNFEHFNAFSDAQCCVIAVKSIYPLCNRTSCFPFQFVLTKKRGFGFTLCGSSTVSVSKVEPGL